MGEEELSLNEYASPEHALAYLAKADTIPHRTEGEAVLLDFLHFGPQRVLDLGCGDGRTLSLIRLAHPAASGVALDFSPTMLAAARCTFEGDDAVEVVEHNLQDPLPALGSFDAVVSSFAIHHTDDHRKRSLYAEIFDLLDPGGVFLNLEHVASTTEDLHDRFLMCLGMTRADEDPSNMLAPVNLQLGWLTEIGFADVDCYWKWLELALIGGKKPLR